MAQFGWAQACAGVAFSSAAADQSLNGPPDAVSSIRAHACRRGSQRTIRRQALEYGVVLAVDWNQLRPGAHGRLQDQPPDMMMASLLATISRLPAPAAASVDRSPAAPTIAAITYGASGMVASSSKPEVPASTLVGSPACLRRCSSRRTGFHRQGGVFGPELQALSQQPFDVAVGGQAHDTKPVRMPGQHIQCIHTNAAR